MNEPDLTDDALDGLLRAATPEPLRDDGFVGRTMAAVDQAARHAPVRRRAAVAPIRIARALAAEERHHAMQARLWRWAIAGLVAGFVLLVMAVLLSPGDGSVAMPPPQQWYPLCLLMAGGALWFAWRELRAN